MNTLWSRYIQSTEELYISREMRFRTDNSGDWLPKLSIRDGMNILEVGCGGGILLHRIKELLPGVLATGIDRDDGHIAFARKKAAELGLDCRFLTGDALALPFGNDTFDKTLSYTVFEHVETRGFLGEQFRVLKPGGSIVVLSVRTAMNLQTPCQDSPSGEEKALLEKAWQRAASLAEEYDKQAEVAKYELSESEFPKALVRAGFTHVNIDFATMVCYAPDNDSVPLDLAVRQINSGRLDALDNLKKVLRINPDALTSVETSRLVELINTRYDRRLKRYRAGDKVWDMATSTMLIATGRKE